MEQDMRPAFVNGADKGIDHFIVGGAAHSLLSPSDLKRVVSEIPIVGSGVDKNRKRRGRMQSGAGGVERELADWNPHAASALVAEAEDTLAVTDHDGFNMIKSRMREYAADLALVRYAEKQAARLAKYLTK